MTAFIGEIIGTMILILLGNGVVANAVLKDSKGEGSGWMVITMGWAIAVFTAVFIVAPYSGAHLNPAVTLGLAVAGKFAWAEVPFYLIAQILGAILGAVLVYLTYRDHYAQTDDADGILATFCTAPAIRSTTSNLITEVIGTFVLVYAVLYITGPIFGGEAASLGSLDALPVALVVLGVGLSLGGPTGYAINPARDLGPRIAHAILPIKGKRDNDWGYAWIPVAGPILGGVIAAGLYLAMV
ncbi:MAG: MIP/aquaporin family protein [Saprospiraceae bacterium]